MAPFSQALHEAPQLLAPARVTQLAQRLGLDLPDALPRDREVLSNLFQRVVGVLADPKALAQDALLARREGLQRVVDLALQVVADGCVQWRDGRSEEHTSELQSR